MACGAMCVCVCVCVCVYMRLHKPELIGFVAPAAHRKVACGAIYVYIYIHTYIYTCVCGGGHAVPSVFFVFVCVCVCVCVCVYNTLAKISIYACVYICGSCGFVCVCIYTIYTQYLPGARRNTHTHTHTHTPYNTTFYRCQTKTSRCCHSWRHTFSKVLSKVSFFSKHAKDILKSALKSAYV
jgi:hypothetical protein